MVKAPSSRLTGSISDPDYLIELAASQRACRHVQPHLAIGIVDGGEELTNARGLINPVSAIETLPQQLQLGFGDKRDSEDAGCFYSHSAPRRHCSHLG
jgi:hypothetical protein